MPTQQDWFEMRKERARSLDRASWIPLRAQYMLDRAGEYGYEGFAEEYLGVGSLAVPISQKGAASNIGWSEIGNRNHGPAFDSANQYEPVDAYIDTRAGVTGVHLVLDPLEEIDPEDVWHLNQDLVIALGLKREGDRWVCPSRGYEVAAELKRDEQGKPVLLAIRSHYLKDYLCARQMALRIASYRQRMYIDSSRDHITWTNDPEQEIKPDERWEGRVDEIHEGGMGFGSTMAVFKASREDADADVDVPDLKMDEGIKTESWTRGFSGKKLYRIQGELWREEWVEPGASSPIVREDDEPRTAQFIADAGGAKETGDTLESGIRWLWFKPEVATALLQDRGAILGWYSRYTGSLGRLKTHAVHFGVNGLGLINVFAKDIALLPNWQQQIWAAYNVTPDGGVAEELMASQMRVDPAKTQAPEAYLDEIMDAINEQSHDKFGFDIFKHHESLQDIMRNIHRFRGTNAAGLYALAKDITRVVADRIDAEAIHKIISPPKGEKWGTLKSLEKLLATKIGDDHARHLIGPLVGVYKLRLGDAHLPSSDVNEAMRLAHIDSNVNCVEQGFQMLNACVSALSEIRRCLISYW
jgi:hypothetical protein